MKKVQSNAGHMKLEAFHWEDAEVTGKAFRTLKKIRLKLYRMFCLFVGVLFFHSTYGQGSVAYTWKNVAIGGGGFVSGIIAAPNDPNVFYARTDVGGLYRWNEATKSWIPLIDWVSADERGLLGIDGVAVDPRVKGRVYVLAGTSYWNNGKTMFLRSDDYGNTWEKFDVTNLFRAHGNGMGRANGERIAVDPNNSNIIFIGTRYNGMWKSTNRGTTWTQITSFPVTTTQNEGGICIIAFDKNVVVGGVTQRIYAGVSRANDNIYVSNDGGNTWSLVAGRPTTANIMPQRFALTSDGRYLYVTYGNGGGPHPMLWNGVTDYYNRGAIYKYDVQLGTWTNISPENFMLDLDKILPGPSQVHYGAFSGIYIDPSNESRIIATSINSWRAAQFWNINGTWKDAWGDNIYLSEDGGRTWRNMFRYYWLDGGFYPDYNMVDANGIPWIVGSACHWNGAVVIDPHNPNRAFVTSGNGIFMTENLLEKTYTLQWVNNVQDTVWQGHATWKFASQGLEETVPLDLVSIPGGPLVSVIGDYDGFVHTQVDQYPAGGRLKTIVNGATTYMGTTSGVAFASKATNILAKAAGNSASVNNTNVSICGVTISTNLGATWQQIYAEPTPVSYRPIKGKLQMGKVAVSADGQVILWAPYSYQVAPWSNTDTILTGHPELFRYQNSSWTKCSGIEFFGHPFADPENANVFYIFDASTGYLYASTDKGVTFVKRGFAGTSNFKTARCAPGRSGDIWIPLAPSGGLARSTDGGNTFTQLSNVTYCEAVGFGKEATGTTYPTVFIYGTVGGTTGVFRSTDAGATWVRINDDEHEYGGLANGEFVMGDANVFGRVYMSTAGRGIVYGDPAGSGTTVPVTGVTVSPTTLSLTVGQTATLTATVSPSNATNKSVTWSSSNTSVATVSSTGVVTAVAAGSATITVTTVDGAKTATCAVTVTGSTTVPVTGVTVSPTTLSLTVGQTSTLTATVSPSNATNKSVTWSSSNTSVATVSSTGLVTAVAAGSATITVTTVDGAKTATCAVTVTGSTTVPVTGVTVSPTTLSLTVGQTATLTATVSPSNATNKSVTWSSSNTSVATVSSTGVVTAVAAGSATITVTTVDGAKTATCAVTVTSGGGTTPCANPVSKALPFAQDGSGEYCFVTSGTISYVNSWNMQLVEINGVDYTNKWSNSMPAAINGQYYIHYVANVSWAHLEVNGSGGGSTTVPVTGVTVSPTTLSLTVGQTSTLTATVSPSNATNKSVTWSSSNTSVATVSSTGVVTAVAAGSATITVTTVDGAKTATCAVTVTGSTTVPVTGVTVSPTTLSLTVGQTSTLTATVSPSNATNKSVTWSSNNTSVATVSSTGVVTAVAAGSATITVTTVDGAKTATCAVTVTGSTTVPVTGVTVSPTTLSLTVGQTSTLTATVSPSNATNKSVTWSSSNTSVATVSSTGVVTAVAAGSATITVTTVDGAKTATCAVTVTSGGGTTPCANPVAITIPFSKDGAGEFCYVSSQEPAYVNSWNMDRVEINGVDYTNKWSNVMPAAIGGKWYIYYKGSYAWSHFEAPAAKSVLEQTTSQNILIYPVPFEDRFTVEFGNISKVERIEIYNIIGSKIKTIEKSQLNGSSITIDNVGNGKLFIIRVVANGNIIERKVVRK